MEKELEYKIFMLEEYNSKENMEEQIKEYIYILKNKFPLAIITKEFYKGNNVLVRATQINNNIKSNDKDELEREEVRIKEKGINGLGENVNRTIKSGKSREKEIGHNGGNERERGGH